MASFWDTCGTLIGNLEFRRNLVRLLNKFLITNQWDSDSGGTIGCGSIPGWLQDVETSEFTKHQKYSTYHRKMKRWTTL